MSQIESLFKSYDIRGTYPTINSKIYYLVAIGFVKTILIPKNMPLKVCVIHDGRYTSKEFYNATIQGLIDSGAQPVKLGLGSTDMLYAACQLWNTPGVMITASHNPKDDNGIKVVLKPPTMLGLGTGLEYIRDFVITNYEIIDFSNDKIQIYQSQEVEQAKLLEFFSSKIDQIAQSKKVDHTLSQSQKSLKLVVDCGNGMGGYIMQNIMPQLYPSLEFVPLYWDVDGNFPNHSPDPQNFDNLKDIQTRISETSADGGFAFDGDGDRVFFIDENSKIINGDFLNSIIAKYMLEDFESESKYNKAIVHSHSSSRCFPEQAVNQAAVSITSAQGHTNIKQKMLQYNAIYGGEFSGHHYFADFGFMDSGVIAAAYIIKIMVLKNLQLSDLVKDLNKSYFLSNLVNLEFSPNIDFEQITTKLKEEFSDADTISTFDGLNIFYPDWKFSLRKSNTEPKVRLIVESRYKDQTQKRLNQIKDLL